MCFFVEIERCSQLRSSPNQERHISFFGLRAFEKLVFDTSRKWIPPAFARLLCVGYLTPTTNRLCNERLTVHSGKLGSGTFFLPDFENDGVGSKSNTQRLREEMHPVTFKS